MKIVHWAFSNGSGLNRVAVMLSIAERALGLDSVVSFTDGGAGFVPPPGLIVSPAEDSKNADVHVLHSMIPDDTNGKKLFLAHGTPEHCFNVTVDQMKDNYAGGDALMVSAYWVNRADAVVTFWPRHAYIWQSIAPKQRVETVPLGVDRDFWCDATSKGKFAGEPSILNCENFHNIKWPIDVFLSWPLVMNAVPKATLHAFYIPHNMHRFVYPLLYMNGVAYKSFSGPLYFNREQLRNNFKSVDYYISPVRYGDFNTLCLEAKAVGCKIISYKGNPYADFWMSEGDQRTMAKEIIGIITGQTMERVTDPVPDISETAKKMKEIYESL